MLATMVEDPGPSPEEVQRFVERGYLWLRGCFSPETARSIVEGVFGPEGSLERCTKRTARGEEELRYDGQPLSDCRRWPGTRVDVDTGFQIPVARLSPRLARTLERLTAPGELSRPCLGEKWILNVDHRPDPPTPEALDRVRRDAFWHIDTPSPDTTLVDRFDALTLLVLWSDVEEHGGGTLFAPDSLDRLVQELAAHGRVDTAARGFGPRLVARCRDLRAQVGRAGDVLVLHPFVLHARPANHRAAVRILENPTFTVRRPLDYRRTNPHPSPVEACVIRRLRAAPTVVGPLAALERERDLEARARTRLIERAPSHFFPYTGRGSAGAAPDPAVPGVDRFLFETWLRREARALAHHQPGPLDAARGAVELVRSRIATERDLAGLTVADALGDPASLAERAFALSTLGFTNAQGTSYLLARLLRAMGHEAHVLETRPAAEGGARHALVLLASEGGGAFVDAWSEVPVMWVDGFDVARACRDWPAEAPRPRVEAGLPGAPRYGALSSFAGDRRRGLVPRDDLLRGRLRRPDELAGADPAALRAAVEAFCRGEAGAPGAAPEVWRAFLRLRLRHLDGALADPAAGYEALLEDPALKGATRRLVRALAKIARARDDADDPAEPARPARKPAASEQRPGFDVDARMRRGDVSVWPRWDPRPIDDAAMRAAWSDVFERRGTPGVPATLRAYTHFAYCASSCNFCMYWHQVPKERSAHARYVSYLVSRVRWFAESFGRVPIDAAYFGGGTPTATPPDQLARYLEAFTAAFDVRGELTVEGHPGTTDLETVRVLADHGVRRLSMGLQSLEHDVLVRITRRNAPLDELAELVAAARARGMIVNLDLILGLPGQSLESFRDDCLRVTELGPDFVTMYVYEPVARLPERPGPEMTYRRALTDELLARLDERGYALADPLVPQQRSARLKRVDGAARPALEGEAVYAQFDETPSHTLAFGPGAYGHVFGRYWYREVTSMATLEEGRPRYLGTTLTAVDECRSIVLDALDRGRSFDAARIAEATGVDVRRAFAAAFELAEARGIFRRRGERFDVVDREGREEVIDRLVPAPPKKLLRVLDRSDVEPALVALRRDETEAELDRAALLELREALKIPATGYQICRNVWVGRRDGGSLLFHVGGPKVAPLRVAVAPPRPGQPAFIRTDRFAIRYATASGGAPNRLERRFLMWLKARVAKLDAAGAARAAAVEP